MIVHEIKNQHGKHITDEKIRDEIIYALDHDMCYTYYDDKRIDIESDTRTDQDRVTLVRVEGIHE